MARLVVIAPGRGSYNRTELGYFDRFDTHPGAGERQQIRAEADRLRAAQGRPRLSELDGRKTYSSALHLPGENASALIFAAGAADYTLLDRTHEVVAVLGNSMGWYSTLFTGGALDFADSFRMVDTMGWYQKGRIVGGQAIYPLVDDSWNLVPQRLDTVHQVMADIAARGEDFWVGESIRLGGQVVLAGTEPGVRALLETLPKIQLGNHEYPFRLARHGAFHTHLMRPASQHGCAELGDLSWRQPRIPMIDGRGHIWRPYQSSARALNDYTLVDQVLQPFDFTASVRVALREFNPDHLVLLGPGETLGGAIAQVMIMEGWRGIRSKQDFLSAQKSERPPLIAMNRPDQARLVI